MYHSKKFIVPVETTVQTRIDINEGLSKNKRKRLGIQTTWGYDNTIKWQKPSWIDCIEFELDSQCKRQRCFQGVEEGWIGNKWVNMLLLLDESKLKSKSKIPPKLACQCVLVSINGHYNLEIIRHPKQKVGWELWKM